MITSTEERTVFYADVLGFGALDPVLRPHYEGYLSVALKAVLRLRHSNPEQAEQALATAALHDKREQIRSLLAEEPDSHLTIISDWESVLSQARH